MKREVRLSGKDLFIFYHKGLDKGDKSITVGGCTNKRVLAKKTGIDYNTLMWVFTRKRLCYYETADTIVLKLLTSNIEKGGQSMARRGRGGMESFVKYISRRVD